MKTKKTLSITALLIVAFFIFYAVNSTPVISDQNYTYISNLVWYNRYEDGAKVASELNKPMFVYFWTIWCTYCEKMHKEVYDDPTVNKILKEDWVLIAVDMDVNKEDTNKFGVSAPPHEIFLLPNGDIITRIPGYVPRDQFLSIILSAEELAKSRGASSIKMDNSKRGRIEK